MMLRNKYLSTPISHIWDRIDKPERSFTRDFQSHHYRPPYLNLHEVSCSVSPVACAGLKEHWYIVNIAQIMKSESRIPFLRIRTTIQNQHSKKDSKHPFSPPTHVFFRVRIAEHFHAFNKHPISVEFEDLNYFVTKQTSSNTFVGINDSPLVGNKHSSYRVRNLFIEWNVLLSYVDI